MKLSSSFYNRNTADQEDQLAKNKRGKKADHFALLLLLFSQMENHY